MRLSLQRWGIVLWMLALSPCRLTAADETFDSLPRFYDRLGLSAQQREELRDLVRPHRKEAKRLTEETSVLRKNVDSQLDAIEGACSKLFTHDEKNKLWAKNNNFGANSPEVARHNYCAHLAKTRAGGETYPVDPWFLDSFKLTKAQREMVGSTVGPLEGKLIEDWTRLRRLEKELASHQKAETDGSLAILTDEQREQLKRFEKQADLQQRAKTNIYAALELAEMKQNDDLAREIGPFFQDHPQGHAIVALAKTDFEREFNGASWPKTCTLTIELCGGETSARSTIQSFMKRAAANNVPKLRNPDAPALRYQIIKVYPAGAAGLADATKANEQIAIAITFFKKEASQSVKLESGPVTISFSKLIPDLPRAIKAGKTVTVR